MEPSWRLPAACDAPILTQLADLHPLVVQVLYNRGIRTLAEARSFLSPDYSIHTHDPYLFSDMRACVERIIAAHRSKERVTIYGDYDVDGLSASTLLYDLFKTLGISVDVHINHREKDGYGLQKDAIRAIAGRGTKLVITTDSGISNKDEVALGNELGMDVIITDHHTVPARSEDIPPAYGILHPLVRAESYPFKHLSGGGVAFKLVQGLIRYEGDLSFSEHKTKVRNRSGRPINWEAYEKWLLDLVCISTVGDCMPLIGENRVFATFGLVVLAKTKRLGLQSLLARIRSRAKTLSPHTIGFLLGPRLNAASRMEHGMIAFDLLTAEDEEVAQRLADTLEQKNIDRQKATERVFAEAKEHLAQKIIQEKEILVAYSPEWPLGLLGLVAGKISQSYHRPTILMTQAHGTIAGAGRTSGACDLSQLLSAMKEYFLRFGGHKAAGGFALKESASVPDVIDAFEASACLIWGGQNAVAEFIPVDGVLSFADVTHEFVGCLRSLEPHGQGNPKPVFLVSAATVIDARVVGTTGKHLKLTLQQGGVIKRGIAFGLGGRTAELSVGSRIDCIVEVDENEWNGLSEVQLTVRDFRATSSDLLPVAAATL